MSLRMVAVDTLSPLDRATFCEPTGWAVSTYSSTIARRMDAFRSSSSTFSITSSPAIPRWHSIVSSANSSVVLPGPEPQRDLAGEQPPGRREDDAIAHLRNEPGVEELGNLV